MKKPVIGIVLDREVDGDYSIYPYYVIREDYFTAVTKAGGIPIAVPALTTNPETYDEIIDSYAGLLDGLLMPGGDYDIPPHVYGDTTVHEKVVTKVERLDFDWKITERFLNDDKPILGICLGQQLLSVILGGALIQDVDTEMPDSLEHYEVDRYKLVHDVEIVKDSLLYKILGKERLAVNSHHHQAVKEGKGNFEITARSTDGVVEAIEVRDKKFCLGVQWHPEHIAVPDELKLFEAFVEACRE